MKASLSGVGGWLLGRWHLLASRWVVGALSKHVYVCELSFYAMLVGWLARARCMGTCGGVWRALRLI